MIKTASAIYFAGLSLWVGGLATLSFVVAPLLFKTDRAHAGLAFGAILRGFAWVEGACAVLVVAGAILLQVYLGGRAGLVRIALALLMTALLAIHACWISPRIAAERVAIPDFQELPAGHPSRARFDSLHRWSVRVVGLNIVLGFSLLALSAASLTSSKLQP